MTRIKIHHIKSNIIQLQAKNKSRNKRTENAIKYRRKILLV